MILFVSGKSNRCFRWEMTKTHKCSIVTNPKSLGTTVSVPVWNSKILQKWWSKSGWSGLAANGWLNEDGYPRKPILNFSELQKPAWLMMSLPLRGCKWYIALIIWQACLLQGQSEIHSKSIPGPGSEIWNLKNTGNWTWALMGEDFLKEFYFSPWLKRYSGGNVSSFSALDE